MWFTCVHQLLICFRFQVFQYLQHRVDWVTGGGEAGTGGDGEGKSGALLAAAGRDAS